LTEVPCLRCQVESLPRRLARAAEVIEPLGLELRPEEQARYEQVRRRRMAIERDFGNAGETVSVADCPGARASADDAEVID